MRWFMLLWILFCSELYYGLAPSLGSDLASVIAILFMPLPVVFWIFTGRK